MQGEGLGRFIGQPHVGQCGTQKQFISGQIDAVLPAVQAQCLTALAGAVEEVLPLVGGQLPRGFSVSQAAQGIRSVHRGKTPQQYGGGFALRLGDEVETAVHPVDEIDVGVARRAEHGGVAGGLVIAVGMGGLVDGAYIGLCLRDAADHQLPVITPRQIAARQGSGDLNRISRIKLPRKYCHFHPPVVCLSKSFFILPFMTGKNKKKEVLLRCLCTITERDWPPCWGVS